MGKGRPKGSGNIDWQSVVDQCRANPGRWVAPVELAAVAERTIRVIRERERHALRLEDGVIRVRVKAHTIIGGQAFCTLFTKLEKEEVAGGQSTRG